MGCCLRLMFLALWRALLAAFVAMLFARVDAYVERRYGSRFAGRAYRAWRGDRIRRGAPPEASSAVEGTVRRDHPRQR
jgi:hypothetical protein